MIFDWLKKKYVYSPDNPSSIHRLFLPDGITQEYFSFTCPEKYWFQLLSIGFTITLGAGIRTMAGVYLNHVSNNVQISTCYTKAPVSSNHTFYMNFSIFGCMWNVLSQTYYSGDPLPDCYYVFPGEYIQIFWLELLPNDIVTDVVLTMKRYELY